ncbi:hypothetical protein D1007_25978 [Hordeum vulgare]|nr:hypothetical protein D1007_25978 [Hordeum vulgare]
MAKMPLQMMTPPGVMLQILQDILSAYTQNGPAGKTVFKRFAPSVLLSRFGTKVEQQTTEGALQLFHECILEDNLRPEERKLRTIPQDLLLLLHDCPDVQVSEELKRVP